MEKNLVIVESPAKAKTIKKILGDDFVVMSSYGHIRDLQKKNLGIDIEHDFNPEYEIPEDKKKTVIELKTAAKKAETVWLASDEDREGEAISWHLSIVLGLDPKETKRIVFHEITKDAIKNAISNPRIINMDTVNAQQARRILDRLVGFSLSPLLWKKIKRDLSAGRVQSVAVKLLVEREREINDFKSKSEYKVVGYFNVDNNIIKTELNKKFKTKKEAEEFLKSCINQEFHVSDITKKPGKKSPAPPFTTSTLQQEAGRKLGYSVSQTMKYAQTLYENGHITYMRTDSLNLSALAINSMKKTISKNYGENYSKERKYTTKTKGAQEAHEAIRPSYSDNQTVEGTRQEKKLYELIWKRALASQMSDALVEKTTITINNTSNNISFIATGEVITFDGFLKLYKESTDDEQDEDVSILPQVALNQIAMMQKIEAQEKYSNSPARYTEASLVKKMEELGIGRPSTYAPTISTIQQREYVVKSSSEAKTREVNLLILEKNAIKTKILNEKYNSEVNKLYPTSMGVLVTDYLSTHFNDIMDYNFTAQVEEKFDDIEEGKLTWNEMIKQFYAPFFIQIENSLKEKETTKWERELGNDPKTGFPIILKLGKFGPYATIEDGSEKPIHASLKKNQNIETVSLEEVLELFKLPRNIGIYENDDLIIAIGRFGPYVKNNSAFYSLAKQDDPYTIVAERAIEIIEQKKLQKLQVGRTFEEMEGLKILSGKFGPYISYGGKNYKIPKGNNPDIITLEECKKIIENKDKKK
ncbi:MAG: type I DNA topoisomerase [Bacteroidales bacterium]|jgi:DNA topoisomerase-1|nr:type I DNA topoisomerase [Bacteroidales bacterium]